MRLIRLMCLIRLSALCALSAAATSRIPSRGAQHGSCHPITCRTGAWIKHEMKISRRQISPIKSYRQNLCGLWHPKVANASRRDANGPIMWRTHPSDILPDATHGMPCAVFSVQRRPRGETFHKKRVRYRNPRPRKKDFFEYLCRDGMIVSKQRVRQPSRRKRRQRTNKYKYSSQTNKTLKLCLQSTITISRASVP